MTFTTLRIIPMLGLLFGLAMLPSSWAEPDLCGSAPDGYDFDKYKYVDCMPLYKDHEEIEACCVVWTEYATRCQNPKSGVEEAVDLQLLLMDMMQKDTGGNPFSSARTKKGHWTGWFGLGTTAIPSQEVYNGWWQAWMVQDEDFIPESFEFRMRTKGDKINTRVIMWHSCPAF